MRDDGAGYERAGRTEQSHRVLACDTPPRGRARRLLPTRSVYAGLDPVDRLLVGFCFNVAEEGIVIAHRKKFEFRLSDEDRQRLRTLAQRQAQTESAAVRALIRAAHTRVGDEHKGRKEEEEVTA